MNRIPTFSYEEVSDSVPPHRSLDISESNAVSGSSRSPFLFHIDVENLGVSQISEGDFLRLLNRTVEKPIQLYQEVLDESVRSLLKNRDFLALQLDLAFENISENEFEKVVEEEAYLCEPKLQDEKELQEKILTLLNSLSSRITSPDVAMIFGCPVDQADKVMGEVGGQISFSQKLVDG